MKTAIDKSIVILAAQDKVNGTLETRGRASSILALIEIREAIEEGFIRLDRTHAEGAMMLVGFKESFDTFLETRIKRDNVLRDVLAKAQGHPIAETSQESAAADVAMAAIVAANSGKVPEKAEKPDTPPAEENKSSVTLDQGDFGIVPSESGIE